MLCARIAPLTRIAAARSPEQLTRELDAYELMQLLDYSAGGDAYDAGLYAASQGADRHVALRCHQAAPHWPRDPALTLIFSARKLLSSG